MTSGIRSTIGFVWEDKPAELDDESIDFWLVKAANGNLTSNPAGFDFRGNYAAWEAARGSDKCAAWTWLYATTDGATAAHALYESAPNARCYVIDVEGDDPSGRPVPEAVVREFAATLRGLAPHAPLGFTSYPTAAVATAHGAPWPALVDACDFGMPQIYYETQGAHFNGARSDMAGKPIIPIFSPGDWPGCWELADFAMSLSGGVALWRFPDTAHWHDQLLKLKAAGEIPDPPTTPTTPPATDPSTNNWEPTVHNIDLTNAEHTLVTGTGVEPLQALLDINGYKLAVDGKAGALTRTALLGFQEHKGLKVDAIAGQATFSALLAR